MKLNIDVDALRIVIARIAGVENERIFQLQTPEKALNVTY
jgi:hypothetical protein